MPKKHDIPYPLTILKKYVYNFFIKGAHMPAIRSSADLLNSYNEISTFCHDYSEPVFITKNGKGDLAVMSIEVYEQLVVFIAKLKPDIYG